MEDFFTAIQYPVANIQGNYDMAKSEAVGQYLNPPVPLVATVLPNGQVTITHANDFDPETGVPVYNANHVEAGPLDGSIMGIPVKYLALGVAAYFLFGRK